MRKIDKSSILRIGERNRVSLVTQALARKPGEAAGSRGLHGRQPKQALGRCRGPHTESPLQPRIPGKSHRRLQSCTVRESSWSYQDIKGPTGERSRIRDGSQCPTHCQDTGCSVCVCVVPYGLWRECFINCPTYPIVVTC